MLGFPKRQQQEAIQGKFLSKVEHFMSEGLVLFGCVFCARNVVVCQLQAEGMINRIDKPRMTRLVNVIPSPLWLELRFL